MAGNSNAGNKPKEGFTITELLVALAIVGIVMGFAVAHYEVYRQKASWREVEAALVSFQLAEQNYYLHYGQYSHTRGSSIIHAKLADIQLQATDEHTYLYTAKLLFFPTEHECRWVWITPQARGPSTCW